MNKTDLVNAIAEKSGLAKTDAKKALEATLEAITEAVKNDEKVALIGFGTFETAVRAARQGINPATKETSTFLKRRLLSSRLLPIFWIKRKILYDDKSLMPGMRLLSFYQVHDAHKKIVK